MAYLANPRARPDQREKPVTTMVSAADLASEQAIIGARSANDTRNIAFLSEEAGWSNRSVSGTDLDY